MFMILSRTLPLLLILVTSFLAGTAVQAQSQSDSPPQVNPEPVLFVGDSLAVRSRDYIQSAVGSSSKYPVTTVAQSGQTTPWILPQIQGLVERYNPKTIFVSFGTNDGSDPSKFRERINEFMSYVPSTTCVLWSTIIRPKFKGEYVALNEVLADEAKRRNNFDVVTWQQQVRWGNVILEDGIHPNVQGAKIRAKMFAAKRGRGCR